MMEDRNLINERLTNINMVGKLQTGFLVNTLRNRVPVVGRRGLHLTPINTTPGSLSLSDLKTNKVCIIMNINIYLCVFFIKSVTTN